MRWVLVRYGRRGESWIVLVRCGEVRYGRLGAARNVVAWWRGVWYGMAVEVRNGMDRYGLVRFVGVRHG